MQQELLQFFSQLGVQLSADALLVLAVLLALLVGVVLTRMFDRRQLSKQLAAQKQEAAAQLSQASALVDDQLDQLSHAFSALSQNALQQNNQAFLTLAKQNFEQLRIAAAGELSAKQESFTNLVKPIEQSLRTTQETLKQFDTQRQVSDAQLQEQISNLLQTHQNLQLETRNLSNAMRRPEVRGQWGELTLRRLVELSGMSAHCDFSEQASEITSQNTRLRPDMLVHLPGDRSLVVDVKTPLDAYLNAQQVSGANDQDEFLKKHAKNVKNRIQELAQKQYWQQFSTAPDFVILFFPGDQFLSAALEADQSLLEYALSKQILLATPTSLVGLLRAIAYGWNQDTISRNAAELRSVGQTLYKRLNLLTDHLNKLGLNLDQALSQFNRVAGAFQHSSLPAARKLADLGLSDGEDKTNELREPSGDQSRRVHATDLQDASTDRIKNSDT